MPPVQYCSCLPNRGMFFSCIGKPVVLSKEVESVLVGAAILGACASGDFASIQVCSASFYLFVCLFQCILHFDIWHCAQI